MFMAYVGVQWWSFRRSDGGGEFIQRMLATRDEQQARLAGWVFLIVNYLIRSWLWVVVALAAVVLLPDQSDPELGYPALAVQLLPPVALGLVVISLVAVHEHSEHVGQLGGQLPHPRSLPAVHSSQGRGRTVVGWAVHDTSVVGFRCGYGIEQQHRHRVSSGDRDRLGSCVFWCCAGSGGASTLPQNCQRCL